MTADHTPPNQPKETPMSETESPQPVMACDSCPIEFKVEKFAQMVADGWRMSHNFQAVEYYGGRVIPCTGHFTLREPRPATGPVPLVLTGLP